MGTGQPRSRPVVTPGAGRRGALPLLLAFWCAPAAAATVHTAPGRALVLPPCTSDPAATCWQDAALATRFAPPVGSHAAAVEDRVRLAWSQDGLLVDVQTGPIEVGVGRDEKTPPTTVAVLGPGLHTLPLVPPATAGSERALWLNRQAQDRAGDGVSLPWTPAGDGDALEPAVLLLAPAPSAHRRMQVETGPDGLHVVAPGAREVKLRQLSNPSPEGGRDAPDPWVHAGKGPRVDAQPPLPGWVAVQARWNDDKGRAIDLTEERLWSSGPPVPAVSWAGLHPLPKQVAPTPGAAFVLGGSARVCMAGAPEDPVFARAASLLASELTRFTGARVGPNAPGPCRLVLTSPAVPLHHPDAFRLVVDRKGARVEAGRGRAAVWGALALADLIGPDGAAPAATVEDWPDIDRRILYWSIRTRGRPDWAADDATRFLERVVARGRYTDVFVQPQFSFVMPGNAELTPGGHPFAELAEMVAFGERLGIEMSPAVPGMGHADGFTQTRPDLAPNQFGQVLDMRRADTRAMLTSFYDDLLSAFPGATEVHLGHDEILWRTQRLFGDERDPRNGAAPAAVLVAESLAWHLDWAKSRALRPWVWSDMLLEGWNGRREGSHLALDLLDIDPELTAMAWSKLGDSLANLPARGMRVARVHTGYVDWKRADLEAEAPAIAGEGLGLFAPAPWAAQGPATGSRMRNYFTSAVVLAGTTGWRIDQARVGVDATYAALAGLPAFLPGLEARAGHWTPLLASGEAPESDVPEVSWPPALPVGDTSVPASAPRVARAGAPVRLTVPGGQDALALWWALDMDQGAVLDVDSDAVSRAAAADRAVARVTVSGAETPLLQVEQGLDVFDLAAEDWSAPLWNAADTHSLASPLAQQTNPNATNRRVWRRDVALDGCPDGCTVEVAVDRPGVRLIVVGSAAHARSGR